MGHAVRFRSRSRPFLRCSFALREREAQAGPDREFVIKLNKINIRLAGAQGATQILIIVVMLHFVVG